MTNSLRKLVKTQLSTVNGLDGVYYGEAVKNALYPHAVFTFKSINTGDMNRSDYNLVIDLWDKGSAYNVEDLADLISDKFKYKNLPQTDILPTFFTENRNTVEDDDKTIKHIQLSFVVQTYKK